MILYFYQLVQLSTLKIDLAGAGGKSTSFLSSMGSNGPQGSGNINPISSNNPDILKAKFLEVCDDKQVLSRIWEDIALALRKDMPKRAESFESISGDEVISSPLVEEEL